METFKYHSGGNLRNFLKTKKDRIWAYSTQTLCSLLLNDKGSLRNFLSWESLKNNPGMDMFSRVKFLVNFTEIILR